jgi:hypothetical protein
MYASCASPCTPLVRFLWATLVRGNLSLVINIVGQSHCSQEKRDSQLHPQHVSWPICGSLFNFSPPHNHWSSRESQVSVGNKLHQFIGLISPACDQYIQYLLAGPTYQSLTDTSWGYNLRGADFPHHTLCPFQSMILRFPLMAPSSLRLSIST